MKEFFKIVWKILLAMGAIIIMVLGMKRKQESKRKKEFETEKHTIEKDIATIGGKEEVVFEIKEKQKEELEEIKKVAEKLETSNAKLDKTRESDINYLKDFVKKYRN